MNEHITYLIKKRISYQCEFIPKSRRKLQNTISVWLDKGKVYRFARFNNGNLPKKYSIRDKERCYGGPFPLRFKKLKKNVV